MSWFSFLLRLLFSFPLSGSVMVPAVPVPVPSLPVSGSGSQSQGCRAVCCVRALRPVSITCRQLVSSVFPRSASWHNEIPTGYRGYRLADPWPTISLFCLIGITSFSHTRCGFRFFTSWIGHHMVQLVVVQMGTVGRRSMKSPQNSKTGSARARALAGR